MDTLTSIFVKILKGGNMVRITNKETKEKKVGILVNFLFPDTINLKTVDNNFIGELFTIKEIGKKPIQLRDYYLDTINKKEFQCFRKVLVEAMEKEINPDVREMYKKVIYKVDENIRNTENIKGNVLKMGYKMYPSNKIEIFNRIMTNNVYVNEEIPTSFIVQTVVSHLSGKKKDIKKRPMNKV